MFLSFLLIYIFAFFKIICILKNVLEYLWVAEEICEVILEICNPLPIDLDVSNIVN